MSKAIPRLLPALLWAGLLLWLSSLSSIAVPGPRFPHSDKAGHFGLYFVLGFLTGWGTGRMGEAGRRTGVLGAIGFAALDERWQARTPGRIPSWGDWVADLAGILVGTWLAGRLRGVRGRSDGEAPGRAG